jgi:hypothetical protein
MASPEQTPNTGAAPSNNSQGGVAIPDPDSVTNFDSDIQAVVNDEAFISGLRSNFMEKISDKRSFFKELFGCIFVRPQGVRRLDQASKAGISNREYQAFASDVVAYLKKKYKGRFDKMTAQSPLFKRYNCVWPECSDMITKDILDLGTKIEQQKKVQEMLGRTPAPQSGQPK